MHGASAAIYEWLGINQDEPFADEIVRSCIKPGDACYLAYPKQVNGNDVHVIHAVAPDLRFHESFKGSVAALAAAYGNVLAQFLRSGRDELWLLPLSGGVNAGSFAESMPEMTWEALRRAFEGLSAEQRDCLQPSQRKTVCMCIFVTEELEAWERASREVLFSEVAGLNDDSKWWVV